MDMVNVKVNGIAVSVPKGSTILEAARYAGVEIPTLCFLKDINEIGACRICVVEATGARGLVTACVYPVSEGMEIQTNTEKVQKARKTTLELILSTHEKKCLSCVRSGDCELQKMCRDYGVEDADKYAGFRPQYELDTSAAHLVRDNNKCILCRRCVAACKQQFVSVIGANDRGIDTHIACAFEKPLNDVPCVSCGQCIVVCPTGALTEKDDTDKVWAALADPTKHVVVQTAPSIRATLGEDTGAAVIFGATGGVMEAALRTANDWLTGKDNGAVEFKEVRGTAGLKEATYNIGGLEVKVAVVSGIAGANYVMSCIQDGTAPWTFVEVMCCPGGCVNGGGQPIQPASVRNVFDLKAMRAKALYDQDAGMTLRKSHDNPMVKAIYEEFFGSYGSHKAHEVLHTSYVGRKKFK